MSLRPIEEARAMTQNISPIHPSLCAASLDSRPSSALWEVTPLPSEKKRKGKSAARKWNSIPDYVHMPETVFSLSECKNHHICSDSMSLHTQPSQTSRTLFSPELQSSMASHLSAFPNLWEDDVVSSQAKSPDQINFYFHFSLFF
jgi:hypothetical protein